ncbi:MAG: hypothetical protein GQ577_13175 [Woeseiaceae bacterium]|nr:hypothetical protein [Woeseiaceae bacterium]
MKRTTFSTLIPLILLAGCSGTTGGYGGPGDNNPPPPPPAGFTITSANGAQVTQVAYESVLSSGDIAGMAGNTGLTANNGGVFAMSPAQQKANGAMQMTSLPPMVTPCASGTGTLTVTLDIVDLNVFAAFMLSPGDTILSEYAACIDVVGETIDGTIDSTVGAFEGSILGAYNMTMTMTFTDFQVATAEDVFTANGDGTATLNTLTPLYLETSISGNSITTDSNSATETLTAYSSAQTFDARVSPSPYTITGAGTLDSTRLSGVVSYSTETTFTGFNADYPTGGALLVAGDTSSARLIAEMNGIDVTIEIYSNTTGTDMPDDTIMTTWAELAAM